MNASRPGDTFQPGDLLNNTYRIEAVLGRGGTSEVYRARSEISGRVVALKALRAEFSRNDDYLVLMTREEEIREIRHDGIVRYYDNQRTDDGHVYLVMDYVDGPGLDAKLKAGGMPAGELLTVAARVTAALGVAHAKNITHRDLSPANIILRNGNPADAVIIDFGIAKDSNPGAETIVGNEFAGKYAYAAPEQLSGQTDARSDIYALGALLLSVFRGKAPDIGNNPMEVVQNKGKPLNTEGVPEPLKSLIDRMTHPDRAQRLQSATAVLEAMKGAPVGMDDRTVIVPRAKTVLPPKTAKASPAPPKPANPAKKSGALLPLFGLLLLVAIGAGGWFSGIIPGLLAPSYPAVAPFTLVAERKADSTAQAVGYVPSEAVLTAVSDRMAAQGGTVQLTLASGDIAESWGEDILQLLDTVADLPEWRILASGNQVRVTGLANDRAQQLALSASLSGAAMPAALDGTVQIDLGPRFLSPELLRPLLQQYADCGELALTDAPPTGYPQGATVVVTGRVAEVANRVALTDAIAAVAGDRTVQVDAEVLNPTLCLIDATLPDAPAGGFGVAFGFGDRPEENTTGRYLVGENPVIDVTVPSTATDGFLFVAALDVSGNVFHLLPNLANKDNDINALRNGATGPFTVRVAYSLADAKAGNKLAFLVDDSALGKTKILVIHAANQIFDGLRPTTESAGGFASALEARTAPVLSLDSRILTTANP